ncbi:MAG: alpha/beta hydrolase [Lachnospiraceae bacterium]|nr:alpha/beta hydrolase [Lachnospiraceae bacterium]
MNRLITKMLLRERDKFDEAEEKQLAEEEITIPPDCCIAADIPFRGRWTTFHPAKRMDVYHPMSAIFRLHDHPLYPVIVNIHGGGLIMGSKEFNTKFCLELCRRGFVVLSLEYRLIPDVDVFQQFDDVARGMDQAIETLLMFHGDPDRVFVVGDSAGAYLAIYVCAMQNAPGLAKAANVQPSYLDVKALGLISGMFYTCRMDKIGLSLPTYLYGEHYKKSAFYPYTNPEHPDIIQNLPSCYLITSHDDMLQRYTLDFANALRKGNAPYSLVNYPKDKRLTHAFSVFHPELDASQEAIDGMTDYFLKR